MRASLSGCTAAFIAWLLVNAVAAIKSPELPLELTLIARRENDAAVGVAQIKNPTNKPLTVGKIAFDIRFMMKGMDVHKDDIRQQFGMKTCGGKALPLVLPAGGKIDCPFNSRTNIYGGKISIVAAVVPANGPDYPNSPYTGWDVITEVQTAAVLNNKTYKEVKGTAIPGKDISCGQKDWDGSIAVFCTVCGGRATVEAACNKRRTECVAYDMENADCGNLKSSQGPREAKEGFSSWLRG